MKKWFPKRAIHLDFHTMPGVYDVGIDFNGKEFVKTLKEANVDYITTFAKCNLGFAYYPTKIGIIHPGLKKRDLLGEIIEECHKEGIMVSAYFNVGLDHENSVRHRDWCKVNKEGQIAEMQYMGHFFRKMCLNTDFKDYILGMIEEVIDNYPVDGIFLDCFTLSPCYGGECVREMKKLNIDPSDEIKARDFCWMITEKFMEEVKKILKRKNKDIFLFFNGLPYRKQPTHLELEVLPTGGWGYDFLPWIIRYARTLKKPFFTMTGRFHKGWGDFGGLRTFHSLMFDLYYSVSNGGTCSIGDHMHPRGKLEKEVYDLIGKCYSEIKKIEEFTENAENITEMVIIEPNLSMFYGYHFDYSSLAGATRMLSELKYQFDVSDGTDDISKYKIVILPDNIKVDKNLREKLKKHLKKGGILISSDLSCFDLEKKKFIFDDYKIEFEGEEENNPTYFVGEKEFSDGIPDMPLTIYDQGISIKAKKGSKIIAYIYKPYFNYKSWDWEHENLYTPPEKNTGRPAIVQFGNIIHFSFPVFKNYHNHAYIYYKKLLYNCLEKIYPEPLIKHKNIPSFVQITLASQKNKNIIHILAYIPELRGKSMQIIEEPLILKDIEIGVKNIDKKKIKRIYLVPSNEEIEFKEEGNYIWFKIESMAGYQMVVIEKMD
ncbi:MAG TPA: family 10 glycosylhydrolase [bacterium]|nr:family 10 glycosylhydrolase [bacterium]